MTDNKLEKMKAKMAALGEAKADLTPAKTLEAKNKAKIRNKRLSTYVTEEEKQRFLNLIGRQSESDAIRELVLKFIGDNEK
jgi:hypothetical protein